jgi:hypothetical protein
MFLLDPALEQRDEEYLLLRSSRRVRVALRLLSFMVLTLLSGDEVNTFVYLQFWSTIARLERREDHLRPPHHPSLAAVALGVPQLTSIVPESGVNSGGHIDYCFPSAVALNHSRFSYTAIGY